jgi:hypothetical protein
MTSMVMIVSGLGKGGRISRVDGWVERGNGFVVMHE